MDRADCAAMLAYHLMELRAKEATEIETKESDFKKIFSHQSKRNNKDINPFMTNRNNPFYQRNKVNRFS